MESHQFKIRKEKSKLEKLDFDIKNVSLNNCEIRLIDKKLATKIIVEYEWLKSMPFIVLHCFGLFFKTENGEKIGGVLVFSNDYADNTGVWNKYGYTDKLILLSRGVCLWWTPKNSASFFISRACKWIKENTKYRIVTATVDPAAGEIGTIYQSLNWHYVGVMSGNYYHNRETKRFGVYIDGKLRSSRWVRNKLGTMKRDEILETYPNAIFVHQYRKRRYFHFMDSKTMNKKHFNAIKYLILPYPQRTIETVGIVYQIRNKIDNKKYIGQTTRSLNNRINDYKRGFGNDYMNNAFKKYGWDNFEFSIIDTAQTIEELNTKEIKYILDFNTNDKKTGYNIHDGGRNAIPKIETLEKMSRSHSGIKQTKTWVDKRIAKAGSEEAKKYGKRKSEEERQDLSKNSPKYWLGKKRDESTKEKISKTKKERGISLKQKEILYKRVFKKNLNTGEIIEYESTAHAAKIEGVNQSTISRRCQKKQIKYNFLWSY